MDAWIGLQVMRCTGERMLRSAAEGTAGPEASVSKLQWGTLASRTRRTRGRRRRSRRGPDRRADRGPVADEPSAFDVDQTLMFVSRADTIYGGSDEVQRNIIAEKLLGLPRSYGSKAGR